MSNDPFGHGAGTAESFIARIQSAATPQQHTAALGAYEQFLTGGGAQSTPGAPQSSQASWSAPASPLPTPPPPPSNADAIAAATDKVLAAPTPMAKQRAMDELEALHRANSGEPPEAAATTPEGLEPPRSALEYQLVPPKGFFVQDEKALGDLKNQLFEAGVPAAVAGQAFANAAHLVGAGVLANPEAYDAAVLRCKGALEKQFGTDARSIALDGTAYLNALADKSPALGEHVSLMMADPWAVATAANLQRASRGK